MTALRIWYSDFVRPDLDEIWDTIAQDDPQAADRMIARLKEAVNRLAEYPEAGRRRGDLSAGGRGFPVGNYIIFYRIDGEFLHVGRILHGARDLPRQL